MPLSRNDPTTVKSTLPTSAEELLTVNEDEEMTDEEKQQKLAQLNKHILQG